IGCLIASIVLRIADVRRRLADTADGFDGPIQGVITGRIKTASGIRYRQAITHPVIGETSGDIGIVSRCRIDKRILKIAGDRPDTVGSVIKVLREAILRGFYLVLGNGI